MRGAYTFIEILIVISVVGIVSAMAVNSYNVANERIEFHTEISKVQSMVTNARSSALSDTTIDNINVLFNFGENTITGFEGNIPETGQVLELDAQILEFRDLWVLDDGTWGRIIDPTDLKIQFAPPNAECTFLVNDSENIAQSMFQIGFSRPGDDQVVRYLYFHKKSCLSELLIDDLASIE